MRGAPGGGAPPLESPFHDPTRRARAFSAQAHARASSARQAASAGKSSAAAAWKFSAETIAILVVECIIAIVALQPTMTMTHAVLALLLFPGSIAFVAILESAGYD